MATSIIIIGNPGAGKSTILNGLAGEILFTSGISLGNGLTDQLHEKRNEKGIFFDTPGLADDTHREAAGKAISTALRRGGNFKILFFVLTESGRIVSQDVTTIKLVLDAVPQIKNNYGIVINKIPINVGKALASSETKDIFLTKLFARIPEHRRCTESNVVYLPFDSKLCNESNKLVDLNDLKPLQGTAFQEFVYNQVPTINLTVGKAGDVATNEYEKMNSAMKALEKKMDNEQKMFLGKQKVLKAQLERAKAEGIEQQKRDKELHEQQLAIMQQQIQKLQLQQRREQQRQAHIEAIRNIKDIDEKIRLYNVMITNGYEPQPNMYIIQ